MCLLFQLVVKYWETPLPIQDLGGGPHPCGNSAMNVPWNGRPSASATTNPKTFFSCPYLQFFWGGGKERRVTGWRAADAAASPRSKQILFSLLSKPNVLQFVDTELQELCHVSFYHHSLPGECFSCLFALPLHSFPKSLLGKGSKKKLL